jgi:hypothetical protein
VWRGIYVHQRTILLGRLGNIVPSHVCAEATHTGQGADSLQHSLVLDRRRIEVIAELGVPQQIAGPIKFSTQAGRDAGNLLEFVGVYLRTTAQLARPATVENHGGSLKLAVPCERVRSPSRKIGAFVQVTSAIL